MSSALIGHCTLASAHFSFNCLKVAYFSDRMLQVQWTSIFNFPLLEYHFYSSFVNKICIIYKYLVSGKLPPPAICVHRRRRVHLEQLFKSCSLSELAALYDIFPPTLKIHSCPLNSFPYHWVKTKFDRISSNQFQFFLLLPNFREELIWHLHFVGCEK